MHRARRIAEKQKEPGAASDCAAVSRKESLRSCDATVQNNVVSDLRSRISRDVQYNLT